MTISTPFKGRVGEYSFASEAARKGLVIGFPSIEGIPYDFFLDNGSQTFKIQVKTIFKNQDIYSFDFRKGSSRNAKSVAENRKYSQKDIDFFVIFIEPKNLFYIFPIKEIPKGHQLTVAPHSPKDQSKKYKEAWDLLLPQSLPLKSLDL